jgi:predicted dithiol-disulfide oxidoreductase (DUF899 family)
MEHPKVVAPAEWVAARKELLKKEKEFSRLRDQLSQQRRELPWEKVEKAYVFDGPKGKETLADLFGGRSQLIMYQSWVEGRLPKLLVHLRPYRRQRGAPGSARREAGGGFASSAGADRGVQEAHGMEVPFGPRRTAATSIMTTKCL